MGKRNFSESEFIKGFLATYAQNGGSKTADEMLKRTVGNNGYALGQEFTLTGDIAVKENEINGTKQTYLILTTEEGVELSLMALMGVSSLKGYDLENEVTVEYKVKNDKKSRTVKSDLIAGFDFSQVWKPASRIFLELADMIHSGDLDLKGKTATYLGVAVKPITAKKKGESNGEKFEEGYSRAIETRLWSIE